MKKIVYLFITAMMLVCCFTACSEKSGNTADSSELDICYADMLPETDDIFKDSKIIINDEDGGKMYTFRIKDCNDEQYTAYVNECKENGFSNVEYEGENNWGKGFHAYSDDKKYYLQVAMNNENKSIDISCEKK